MKPGHSDSSNPRTDGNGDSRNVRRERDAVRRETEAYFASQAFSERSYGHAQGVLALMAGREGAA